MIDLNIVIVSFNTRDITLSCLDSIFKSKPQIEFKVYVVDNASVDGTSEMIKKKFPKVELIKSDTNLGFVGGNNLVLRKNYKKALYSLLLNSDTLLETNTLGDYWKAASKIGADIMSCKLLNSDRSFQPNAGDLPTPISAFLWVSQFDGVFKFMKPPSFHQKEKWYYQNNKEVGWVSGGAMLIKSDVFNKIGFLDDKIFMYGEDVDFCWRAKKAGFKILWTDEAEIIHLGGASSSAPKLSQWRGEFLALLFLYKKYYGNVQRFILKILIYFFSVLRIIAFLIVGKADYSKTYAKIITTI